MKPDQLLQELKIIAERLSVNVMEQSFKQTGVNVKSGFCIVKGEKRIILDKHKTPKEKTEILASILKHFPIDDIYIIPAVREFISEVEDAE